MNIILFRDTERQSDRITLDGRRAQHITQVLRCKVGDKLRVGEIRNTKGWAQIDAMKGDQVLLRIVSWEPRTPPPQTQLILALPRPKALKRILRAAASLEVAQIDLVNAWRVEKSYFQSSFVTQEVLRETVQLGCEQGVNVWLPHVSVHPLLMPFLSALPFSNGDKHARVLAHPHANQDVEQALVLDKSSQVTVAIGPEGGWIDREIRSFQQRGFALARCAPQVLTTELALASILGQIDLLRRTCCPTPITTFLSGHCPRTAQ